MFRLTLDFFDPENIKEIRDLIAAKKPILLVGKPGQGKTALANLIAQELHLELITYAFDDQLDDEDGYILESIRTEENPKAIFLISLSKNSILELMAKLAKESKNRLIFESCSRIRFPAKIVELSPPILTKIAQISSTFTKTGNVAEISRFDVRASIITSQCGSSLYTPEKNDFEKADDIFRHYATHQVDSPWLTDNLCNFYIGSEILEAVHVLRVYAQSKNPKILTCLPKATSGKAKLPTKR